MFDKVKQAAKDATGIGLSAQEQYQRAYQKGVFVKDYNSAAKNFGKATEKFAEDNDAVMAARSRANAALYGLLAGGEQANLEQAVTALEAVSEIEQIGTDTEMVKPAPWIAELKALQLEIGAEGVEWLSNKKTMYQEASDLLMKLGNSPLSFADKLGRPGPQDKALPRAYFDAGLSDYYCALVEVKTSPTAAHDYMQKAAVEFNQAGAHEDAKSWSQQVTQYVAQVKEKRHCWMCGREMQGRDIFYKYYPATVEPYNQKQVEAVGGDVKMIETEREGEGGRVSLCTVCGSAVEVQANRYATMRAREVRDWAEPIFVRHQENIEALHERIKALERVAHHH